METAVDGGQPTPGSVIGPTAPGQQGVGMAEESRKGSGAGVALALESIRGAFDEAEAFVDKVCVGWCVCLGAFLLARENGWPWALFLFVCWVRKLVSSDACRCRCLVGVCLLLAS